MATSWDWANGVQHTAQQKPAVPEMNATAWNAPQSPQGREAPTMYSTNSPGERIESHSPGSYNNYQLTPVETTGYQNYQLGGQQQQQQQFFQQQSQYTAAPPASAPPNPPHITNFALAPAMPAQQAAVVPQQAQAANPFDVFAPVASNNAPVDMFGSAPVTPTEASSVSAHSPTSSLPEDDDFWAQMGFGQVDHSSNMRAGSSASSTSELSMSDKMVFGQIDHAACESDLSVSDASFTPEVNPHSLDERGLPVGGDYYKVRVTTPRLGAIFSSASELRNTLYKTASFQFVESLKNRPVVSFRIDGSAAETSGVELGHVLLKVNDEDIHDTDYAVKVLVSVPRPMTLEFYAPGNRQVQVVKTEGQCMVKYDNRETQHPRASKEWKPKYVVIGDLLGKPNVIYMYRSKAEYDIAVSEAQTSPRTLSVKVKQFDITGARILKRGKVKYANQDTAWYYFVVVREFGLPIKISAESEEELAPLYDGVAGYLAKSKRRPHGSPTWMQ